MPAGGASAGASATVVTGAACVVTVIAWVVPVTPAVDAWVVGRATVDVTVQHDVVTWPTVDGTTLPVFKGEVVAVAPGTTTPGTVVVVVDGRLPLPKSVVVVAP